MKAAYSLVVRIVALPVLCSAGACSEPDAVKLSAATQIIDSAGVAIVMNAEPSGLDSTSWRVDSVPEVSIGVAQGPKEYMLSRVIGLVQFADGRVMILNAGTEDVRVYDSTGTFIRSFGGEGQGPGEYINLSRIHRHVGDSLLLVDHEGMRAHVLTADGGEVRRFRPRVTGNDRHVYSAPEILGVFTDGTLLARDYLGSCGRTQPGVGTTFCEDSSSFYRLAEDGRVLAQFGTMLTGRDLSATSPTGQRFMFGSVVPQVFARHFGDNFYYTDGAKPEIRVFHKSRGLARIIRLPANRPATRPKFPDGRGPTEFAVMGSARAPSAVEMQRVMEVLDIPQFSRYFTSLEIDMEGNIWAEESEVESVGRTNRWWVFDSTGVLRTRVVLPREVRVGGAFVRNLSIIGSNFVSLRARDMDGVESVKLFRLRKQEAPR
jgi:hypothetical protein